MVKSRLFTKFLRDIRNSKGQILSVIILSMLGVWVFSGLDAYWRNLEASVESYFDEQRLADFWIMTPLTDEGPAKKINGIKGVEDLQVRSSLEVRTVVPGGARLMLHTVSDHISINIPRVVNGGLLWDNDSRGCLLDARFAGANDLSPGDSVVLNIGKKSQEFIIRGLVMSPEYVFNSPDVIPEPETYGFIYVNKAAFPEMPVNEICVLTADDADIEKVKAALEEKLPGAFILDRKVHKSTQLIRAEISQFKSLSKVFPIMFFAVSVLIVMTTMTRIVENQRTQIGLLKALGYGKGAIVRHYVSFGFYPSLIGAVCGLAAGRNTLPAFLWSILEDIYVLPDIRVAVVSQVALAVCISSVLLTCIICYYTCRRSISESAAALLRPKAPAAGSRVLLERISLIWKRLSFSAKMIQRNLMRNRIRTIMALTGVMSCTALMVTALGLLDSVDHMVSTYYGETLKYDLRADLDEKAGSVDMYRKITDADKTEGIMEIPVSIRKAESSSRTVLLTVVENDQELLSLGEAGTDVNGGHTGSAGPAGKHADTGGQIDTPDAGMPYENQVMVSEKLAQIMGIDAGDTIKLRLPGSEDENDMYVENLVTIQIGQGIYMSEKSWNSLGKGAFIPTALLIKNPGEDTRGFFEGLDEVTGVKSLQSLRDKTKTGLESINSVSLLMVAFALVLAFVVLYNMGILNFMERVREFATLKVLGFHHREIRSLIIKENAIIAVAGILSGIFPGVWLTDLVMKSSEPDDMVFRALVEPTSIAAACCITLIFSLVAQYLLIRKVRGIVMTQALKSVE